MKNLCLFAIAVLLAAGCSKVVAPSQERDGDVIRVGNGPCSLCVSVAGNETAEVKSVPIERVENVSNIYLMAGPYVNGKYGKPFIFTDVGRKFTLSGIDEGKVYIAVVTNSEEIPEGVESIEELNNVRWHFRGFTGPKSGLEFVNVVKNRTTEVQINLKRRYASIYITRIEDCCEDLFQGVGKRLILLDELYLQNVPAFCGGFFWGWENSLPQPSATGEDNWFNPSEAAEMTTDSYIRSLIDYTSFSDFVPSLSTILFFCPPNNTSRKTRLVIRAHYQDHSSETLYRDCFYTIDLPEIRPGEMIKFKKIKLMGIGGESPNSYMGQVNVEYDMTVDRWQSAGSTEEQF